MYIFHLRLSSQFSAGPPGFVQSYVLNIAQLLNNNFGADGLAEFPNTSEDLLRLMSGRPFVISANKNELR